MSSVTQTSLDALYEHSSDPWSFRTSEYEKRKYLSTLSAFGKLHYGTILEVGCGNGELARSLQKRCALYVGVDAVAVALNEARRVVPAGRFSQIYLPDELPDCHAELIVLSEILYFLDRQSLSGLAAQLCRRWPRAELITVNMLGPTGNALSGEEALQHFASQLDSEFQLTSLEYTSEYRIDRFQRSDPGKDDE